MDERFRKLHDDHLTVITTEATLGWAGYEAVCLCGWTASESWAHVREDDAFEIGKNEAVTHVGNVLAAMIEKEGDEV